MSLLKENTVAGAILASLDERQVASYLVVVKDGKDWRVVFTSKNPDAQTKYLKSLTADGKKLGKDFQGILAVTPYKVGDVFNMKGESLYEARDYEIKTVDGKTHIYISKANFRKVHKDFKGKFPDGTPSMMALDPKTGGSALYGVKFVESLNEARKLTDDEWAVLHSMRYYASKAWSADDIYTAVKRRYNDDPRVKHKVDLDKLSATMKSLVSAKRVLLKGGDFVLGKNGGYDVVEPEADTPNDVVALYKKLVDDLSHGSTYSPTGRKLDAKLKALGYWVRNVQNEIRLMELPDSYPRPKAPTQRDLAFESRAKSVLAQFDLDEVSIDTLKSYAQKAIDDVAKGNAKADKRAAGIVKAKRKQLNKEKDALYGH